MKALLCINYKKEKTKEILQEVITILESDGVELCYEPEAMTTCDLVITVGGDGTILKWGKTAAVAGKPLLGINTGTLGFMATLENNELHLLRRLKDGDYRISKRMLLEVSVGGRRSLALNDLVIKRAAEAKLPDFQISSEGVVISRIRADGLVFSTPTGSTAYALSAGGPILEPELSCIEFTPLCAHTLFGRTMVFTGENPLKVNFIKTSPENILVSVDGDEGASVDDNQVVEIKKSDIFLNLIDIARNSFYDAVHNKLMQPLK